MVRVTWDPGDYGDEKGSITIDEARGLLTDPLLGYSRDSADRLKGVFGQDQEIVDWAEREGYTITGLAHDIKIHGQLAPMERPGLAAAINAVEEKQVAGIVVTRLGRLARDFPTQTEAMQRIWRAGGKVYSTNYGEWKPDKPGSPQWVLRKKYAEMDEDELHIILDRLQSGRKRLQARGGYTGGNRFHRRYGVSRTRIQGKWVYRPIPEEQAVIKRVCAYREMGVGYGTIAKTLNTEGVPTVTRKALWSKNMIRKLALRGPAALFVPETVMEQQPIRWLQEKRVSA